MQARRATTPLPSLADQPSKWNSMTFARSWGQRNWQTVWLRWHDVVVRNVKKGVCGHSPPDGMVSDMIF
jgi:hypothetical protein